ncbi:286_t:CDS:2 [Ambispora leptoticha]|uniref:286_t:CDS:1 n=1 Tax=Ambispora leptoticha TaxID=144679 RepID=A0A9N9GXS2_9GLOM|nr:286_t:CDS:2 [Ambispora leptoticha]
MSPSIMTTVSSLFRTRLRIQNLCKLGHHHFINSTNTTLFSLGYFNKTFVELNYVDPRDLAHNTFFALHRPLPTINDQLAPVWGAGQQQPQGWEEEEEGKADIPNNYLLIIYQHF